MDYEKITTKPGKLNLTLARVLVPGIVFLIAVALFLWINFLISSNLEKERILRVSRDLATVQAKLNSEINTTLHLLHGLTALIQANTELTKEEFSTYATALRPKGKGIISIGVAPDYKIKYIFPMKGNESALGLDYRKKPDQWIAIKECVKKKNIVVAGPLTLVQGNVAVVGRSPVFITNPTTGKSSLWGIVSMTMAFETLLDNSELKKREQEYEVAIRGRNSLGSQGEVFYGNPDVFEKSSVKITIPLPTGSWQMAAINKFENQTTTGLLNSFYLISFFSIILMVSVSFLIHRNILVTRNSEKSLREANRSIEKRYDEISVLNKDLEAFNYSISNTLKAPLRHIKGYSGILEEEYSEKLDDHGKIILKKIHDSTRELNNLLSSLHRLSKAASQGLDTTDVCLKTLAMSSFRKAKEIYQVNNVLFETEGEFSAQGDLQLLRIAMDIIIDNAVKYSREVKKPSIWLKGTKGNNSLQLTITDNGRGFEESSVEKIFIPYHSYHTHGDFSGIGLGLATARRIIYRHGGDILASSKDGKGAVFTIILPIN